MPTETRIVITTNLTDCPLPEPPAYYTYPASSRYADKPAACASEDVQNWYSSSATLLPGVRIFEDTALTIEATSGFYKLTPPVDGTDVLGYTPVMGIDSFLNCP